MIHTSRTWEKAQAGLRAVFMVLLLGACSHTAVVPAFEPSDVRYPDSDKRVDVALTDNRTKASPFSHGKLTVEIEFADGSSDELAYFRSALAKELTQRGIEGTVASSGDTGPGKLQVKLLKFEIRNQRSSGFSPMVTFAQFAADVTDGTETVRIAAYSKNAKVPVWTMSEVDRPCYSDALTALVGEVASKINRRFVGLSSSDEAVAKLAQTAKSEDGAVTLQATYELGFTNNPRAIPVLVALSKHESERVRAAALSGLGVLGAKSEFALLEAAHTEGKTASDRYAALKALGDLGTPESLDYLKRAASSAEGGQPDDIAEIAGLYLDARPSGSVHPPAVDVASQPAPSEEPAPDAPVGAQAAPSTPGAS